MGVTKSAAAWSDYIGQGWRLPNAAVALRVAAETTISRNRNSRAVMPYHSHGNVALGSDSTSLQQAAHRAP
ncbi:hypothetical protein D3C87_1640820 [compost metagenome]